MADHHFDITTTSGPVIGIVITAAAKLTGYIDHVNFFIEIGQAVILSGVGATVGFFITRRLKRLFKD